MPFRSRIFALQDFNALLDRLSSESAHPEGRLKGRAAPPQTSPPLHAHTFEGVAELTEKCVDRRDLVSPQSEKRYWVSPFYRSSLPHCARRSSAAFAMSRTASATSCASIRRRPVRNQRLAAADYSRRCALQPAGDYRISGYGAVLRYYMTRRNTNHNLFVGVPPDRTSSPLRVV